MKKKKLPRKKIMKYTFFQIIFFYDTFRCIIHNKETAIQSILQNKSKKHICKYIP